MANMTESNRLNDILKFEAENLYSREKITVLSGQDLDLGAVIGKITKGVGAAPIPTVAGTGDGTMTLLKIGSDALFGSYVVKCTGVVANGGVFSIIAPDGTVLPVLTLAPGAGGTTKYESTHLDFSITDGSTDFAVDDTFTVVVTEGGTPAVIGTGDGSMSAISMGPLTQHGTYQVTCIEAATNGGKFSVTAPGGTALPDLELTAGAGNTTVYANEQINFSITDGATDFVAGDYFFIVVGAGSGKIKEIDFSAVDGSQEAYGFVIAAYDATASDTEGVAIVRDALVDADGLAWPATATTAQIAAAMVLLAGRGILTRESA